MNENTTILGTTRNYGDTIVAFRRPPVLTELCASGFAEDEPEQEVDDLLKIRLVNSDGRRTRATYLIQRRYASRGYLALGLDPENAARVTLAASDKEHTIATITVGLDSTDGMYVAGLYGDIVDTLRDKGHRLCEFTKLAVSADVKSNPVLGAVFHIASIYATQIHRCTDVLIEVNPRHVRFYRRMLGFVVAGPERMDPRVAAPAVLMRLDLAHSAAEIIRVGGRRDLARVERSFYPYFFSPEEAIEIEQRLRSRG